jgi:hypothetical protein
MLIHTCAQLTSERLTDILWRDGALQHGHVVRIGSDSQTYNTGFTSNVASLAVHYSADATSARPPRLWLKMAKTDVHPESPSRGRHEVEFYRGTAHLSAGLCRIVTTPRPRPAATRTCSSMIYPPHTFRNPCRSHPQTATARCLWKASPSSTTCGAIIARPSSS